MFGIDNYVDWWRVGNLFIGLMCLVWLVGGLVQQHKHWNQKTRDLWYSRVVYAIVQCSASIEGVIYQRPITYTLVLLTVAGLVTFKGLYIKGTWGYEA